MHRRHFLALSGAALLAPLPPAFAATDSKWQRDLDGFIADRMAWTHTPGLSIALVKNGRAVFAKGYGYADVARARPTTADTVFQIASVSKTATATAMMMLSEDGAFKLDDAVAPHLDFPFVHPKFPDVPITFRHLFTHTSGISDAVYDDLQFTAPVPPLRDFLVSYLVPGGSRYDAAKCWSDAKPGTQWSYSNVAVALLGYLCGRVNPVPLDALTKARLFGPLGMRETAWRYEGISDDRLALPYDFDSARYKLLPRTIYPDWPAGLLCTSANDFAKFLAMYTAGGTLGGHRYLKPETIAAMFTPDAVVVDPNRPEVRQGLIWVLEPYQGRPVALHPGGDPGSLTVAAIDIEARVAALAFANITPSADVGALHKELIHRLLDKGRG